MSAAIEFGIFETVSANGTRAQHTYDTSGNWTSRIICLGNGRYEATVRTTDHNTYPFLRSGTTNYANARDFVVNSL